MWAYVSVFQAPKRGCSPEECEDNAWVSPSGDRSGEVSEARIRLVVADGASESLLAGRWAACLTRSFGRSGALTTSRQGFSRAYQAATEGWVRYVDWYIRDREQRGVPIQWYEEPGLARGAFSTLITLEVKSAVTGGVWRAAALGDSCLFQVRDEALRVSFPIEAACELSSYPPLLPSRLADNEALRQSLAPNEGDWQPGDSFYVMTDALAGWFLAAVDSGGSPWGTLRDLGSTDVIDFQTWIDLNRDNGCLRDDDVTLVRLDMY